MHPKTRRGWTVIELLVAFAIIMIAAGILYPAIAIAYRAYRENTEEGRQTRCERNLTTIRDAKEAFQKRTDVPSAFVPRMEELVPYAKGKKVEDFDHCPADGKYAIGDMGTLPKCNYVHTIQGVVLDHKIEKKFILKPRKGDDKLIFDPTVDDIKAAPAKQKGHGGASDAQLAP